jgi:transcriptional regulator with XRE-family HTH domain
VARKTDAVAKALGRRVRTLRTAKAWSQERLAEEAGMHRTYMWGIERGTRNPSLRRRPAANPLFHRAV